MYVSAVPYAYRWCLFRASQESQTTHWRFSASLQGVPLSCAAACHAHVACATPPHRKRHPDGHGQPFWVPPAQCNSSWFCLKTLFNGLLDRREQHTHLAVRLLACAAVQVKQSFSQLRTCWPYALLCPAIKTAAHDLCSWKLSRAR